MIKGACHCGAIHFEMTTPSKWRVECNCSICRKLGVEWGHCGPGKAIITTPEHGTIAYRWGDKDLEFHSCKICGATTHWKSLISERFAVNLRLASKKDAATIPARLWDGADTWDWADAE